MNREGEGAASPIPTVHGMGSLGEGEFVVRDCKGRILPEYQAWSGMMGRCYSEAKLKVDPSYRGCTVHPDWHNFQNFAKWYTEQENYGKGYDLDKDILVKGNKLYSPETCCLVPKEVNAGVKFRTGFGITTRPEGTFQVRVNVFGKRISLGNFKDKELAKQAYLNHKIEYRKLIAEKYKSEIGARVYLALKNIDEE